MWYDDERPEHPIEASVQLLGRFLVDPAELLASLAPDGWERSPLMRIFHPTPERLRFERERMRRNLGRPSVEDGGVDAEATAASEPDRPIDPAREVVELLGCALWDVFSDNHAVVDARGTKYSLGSFRNAAGEIAEAIDRRYAGQGDGHDYTDFYLGTRWYAGRADLRSI